VAFRLRPGKRISRELKQIVRAELERAEDRLRQQRGDEDVHESRKSVKKVEALAQLLDQLGSAPPRKDLERLRGARRTLSRLRDCGVVIDTFDGLCSRPATRRIQKHTITTIRTYFERRKADTVRRAKAGAGSLARAGKALQKVRRAARRWPSPPIEPQDLPGIVGGSYRASRKAMTRAAREGRAPDFHEWRKRVKVLWYQLRLAERFVPGLGVQVKEFGRLESALGNEHNLIVFRTKLLRDQGLRHIKPQASRLADISRDLERQLRGRALAHGARLLKLPPKKFEKNLRRRLKPGGTRSS
jgi:CHAD domain-containing protein